MPQPAHHGVVGLAPIPSGRGAPAQGTDRVLPRASGIPAQAQRTGKAAPPSRNRLLRIDIDDDGDDLNAGFPERFSARPPAIRGRGPRGAALDFQQQAHEVFAADAVDGGSSAPAGGGRNGCAGVRPGP